jgi:hypothetical protein
MWSRLNISMAKMVTSSMVMMLAIDSANGKDDADTHR